MGLFGLGKQKDIEISLDEVLAYVEEQFESLDKDQTAQQFLHEFENKKAALFRYLNKLEDKLDAQHYSETIRTFFIQRPAPQRLVELYHYAQDTASGLDTLLEVVQKDYFSFKDSAAQDIMPAQQKLLDIEKLFAELISFFEKLDVEKFERARKDTEDFFAKKEKIARLTAQLPIEEAKKEEPLAKLEKIQQRKEKLINTRSYLVYQEFQEQKDALEKEIKEELGLYITNMELLAEPLDQFMELDDRKKVIQAYLKHPIQALAADKSLVLHDILKDLKKVVVGDALEATKMNKKWLKQQQEAIHKQSLELKKIDDRISKDSIRMMVKEQESYEESVQETLHEIDKTIELIQDEIERMSLQLAWQKVRDSLKLINKKIQLKAL